MIVIADASVLIGLSSIKQLPLLQARFPEGIVIPPAVRKEVVNQGGKRAGADEVAQANWIVVQSVRNQDIVRLLEMDLEEGESEAIALAEELQADVILLDERDARKKAKQLGLRVLGTVGILVWAKRVGKIGNLGDVLNTLQHAGRFRISQALSEYVLREVGE